MTANQNIFVGNYLEISNTLFITNCILEASETAFASPVVVRVRRAQCYAPTATPFPLPTSHRQRCSIPSLHRTCEEL